MSARKRSPKAKAVTPAARARSTTCIIAASYCALLHGDGIGTGQRSRPAASACASSSAARTACMATRSDASLMVRSEEHTSELQSPCNLVCRLLLEKKKKKSIHNNCKMEEE